MRKTIPCIGLLLLMISAFVLSACGGGGGTDDTSSGGGAVSGSGIVASLEILSGATQIPVDGTSTALLRATALDTNSEPVAGVTVTVSTTAGTFDGATSATDTTDSNGMVEFQLTPATNIGTAVVTANANGFSGSLAIAFVAGAPASVTMSSTPSTVSPAGSAVLTAELRDANNNPVSGHTVTFFFTENLSGAAPLDPVTAVTDTNGRATTVYSAGTTNATDTVEAESTNGMVGSVDIQVDASNAINTVSLLVSSPQLGSDGTDTVTITAVVKDAANVLMQGVAVGFSADNNGTLQITRGTTDATGTAEAVLSAAGDKTNRTITVTATAGSLDTQIVVQVTGSSIAINGPSTVKFGGAPTLSLTVTDSAGDAIPSASLSIASSAGNTPSATSVTMDANGTGSVDITITAADTSDIITVSGAGTTQTHNLTIVTSNLGIEAPLTGAEIAINTDEPVTVHWDIAGTDQVGATIQLSTTRGDLDAASLLTNTNGDGSTTISSGTPGIPGTAGPATIVATATDGSIAQIEIEFVATVADTLTLQAEPALVGVNTEGDDAEVSEIIAVVRDPGGNRVKNKTINFTLTDITGGRLTLASATTNSFGRASTRYIAGSTSSSFEGVQIDAEVADTLAVRDSTTLTVSQAELFIALGTGNVVGEPTEVTYRYPYTALVTDSAGGPADNTEVSLSILPHLATPPQLPTAYYKGVWQWDVATEQWVQMITAGPCVNEDANRDGILDPLEDFNFNGVLDPGNVATLDLSSSSNVVSTSPPIVRTDADGFASFDVLYPQNFARWVDVVITARAEVAGTESLKQAKFRLPIAASDVSDENASPPGSPSPFGSSNTCFDAL